MIVNKMLGKGSAVVKNYKLKSVIFILELILISVINYFNKVSYENITEINFYSVFIIVSAISLLIIAKIIGNKNMGKVLLILNIIIFMFILIAIINKPQYTYKQASKILEEQLLKNESGKILSDEEVIENNLLNMRTISYSKRSHWLINKDYMFFVEKDNRIDLYNFNVFNGKGRRLEYNARVKY